MFQNDYNAMLEDFTLTTLGTKTWQEVFSTMNSVRGSNISATSENIKLFIYGIAIHCISDTFAHSAWTNQSGWARVKHSSNWEYNADNSSYLTMRYTTTQTAVQSALAKAYYGSEGVLADFILPSSYFGTFYLGNYAPYAKKVNSTIYNSASSSFNAGDLDYNVSNYNFENQVYYVP